MSTHHTQPLTITAEVFVTTDKNGKPRYPTREQINASAAQYGFRLPSPEENQQIMLAHHERNAKLFARVGNKDMAAQAQAAADKLRARIG